MLRESIDQYWTELACVLRMMPLGPVERTAARLLDCHRRGGTQQGHANTFSEQLPGESDLRDGFRDQAHAQTTRPRDPINVARERQSPGPGLEDVRDARHNDDQGDAHADGVHLSPDRLRTGSKHQVGK